MLNETIGWEYPHFKVMPYGRYLVMVKFGSSTSRNARMCFEVDSEIVPKTS